MNNSNDDTASSEPLFKSAFGVTSLRSRKEIKNGLACFITQVFNAKQSTSNNSPLESGKLTLLAKRDRLIDAINDKGDISLRRPQSDIDSLGSLCQNITRITAGSSFREDGVPHDLFKAHRSEERGSKGS
jgi:hypothetical protein